MILADVNLLLYAHHATGPHHLAAKRWWATVMMGSEPVGIAWIVVLAFVRMSTSRHIYSKALSVDETISIVDDWFEAAVTELVHPTPRHWTVLREQLRAGQAGGNLTTDAHLAALAIEHGATLYSTDRDFTRFPGLKFVNPLDHKPDA